MPAKLLAGGVPFAGPEAVEVDAAVDHLRPAARLGHHSLEPATKPVGDGDDARCPADGEPGRRPDEP